MSGFGLAISLLWPGAARAGEAMDTTPAAHPHWHADFEIDPTAYVFAGHSLHVGLGYRSWRLDIGNFAMDVPGFAEPNDGFAASGSGYGLKLQYFPLNEQRGLVVGIDAAYARFSVLLEATEQARLQPQFLSGINAGYRFVLRQGFYATLWAGVSYALGARDLEFDEAHYDMNPWRLFPAIHLGYALR